ncbi:xylose isomerase-like protein [Phakopsora pachyrhizi]|uniref:Xylose isomerase-like protein n=1 Tax=Phakopsora pachyrhizi TaxID=170000 RepID=A0AAV0BGF2_PHAPC|nr:xylose isomerase-like protein [Phakopsora pachyrhizi]CAH7685119.1 xylose isomerase-like protein [Phakopsora pachyrhizi]
MHSIIKAFEPSIFSHSLGDHSVHDLKTKVRAAAMAGFKAIEISTIDLNHHHITTKSSNYSILDSAREIGDLCKSFRIKVLCLQPLRDVVEAKNTNQAVEAAASMFPIMDALRTDLLLCCSSSLSPDLITEDFNQVVKNLTAIGEAAMTHKGSPKRIAFEALSWGTFINTWAQAWRVVEAVNLSNVGLCLDSFNTLAREWADPTLEGGVQPEANEKILISLLMLREVPGSKIFFLQLADGRRLPEPIPEGTFEAPALMTWSRSSRLFPFELDLGGYLPVINFVRAVLKTGYQGPLSVEVFNSSLFIDNAKIPGEHARRGFSSLALLKELLGMNSSIKFGREININHSNILHQESFVN